MPSRRRFGLYVARSFFFFLFAYSRWCSWAFVGIKKDTICDAGSACYLPARRAFPSFFWDLLDLVSIVVKLNSFTGLGYVSPWETSASAFNMILPGLTLSTYFHRDDYSLPRDDWIEVVVEQPYIAAPVQRVKNWGVWVHGCTQHRLCARYQFLGPCIGRSWLQGDVLTERCSPLGLADVTSADWGVILCGSAGVDVCGRFCLIRSAPKSLSQLNLRNRYSFSWSPRLPW